MTKRDQMNANYAKVVSRIGKTTGASKGTKPAPAAKVTPIIGKDKIGIKIKKRF